MKKKPLKELIVERLHIRPNQAMHEMCFAGHSPVSVDRRLRELRTAVRVNSRLRKDKNFMEWRLTEGEVAIQKERRDKELESMLEPQEAVG